jgi:sarcosine oxidase
MPYDLVVVGLGAMGSAVLDDAARRGLRVLGVEQFAAGHSFGSSHGKSRMIRKAYFEDPAYVPMLLRAYELWADLERRSGCRLLTTTGVLQVGEEASEVVQGVRHSAHLHGLAIECYTAGEIRRRFPMMRPLDDEVGVFEPEGGVLAPEACLAAQVRLAREAGAEARFETRVVRWERAPGARPLLDVSLSDGDLVQTHKLALCSGPWRETLSRELGVPIEVRRKVQVWFEPASDAFTPQRCPAFLLDRASQSEVLYGFPDLGDGVKAAFHTGGEITSMDRIDRTAGAEDVVPIQAALEAWMPGAGARVIETAVCQYDLTPDRNFVVGLHPDDSDVIVAGGFSGHGFKFAPVIGEIVTGLAIDGATRFSINFLKPGRA